VKCWGWCAVVGVALGCSGLTEGEAGVVALEVRVPAPSVLEIGEILQLSARPLDKNGDSVAATVIWRTPDTTATVDSTTGVVTGVAPGTARVQASVGSLTSDLVSLTVLARADTLAIEGDSIFTVTGDTLASPPLVVSLQSFTSGALSDRPVIYEITTPTPDTAVTLTGGVLSDTVQTASDGTITSEILTLNPSKTRPDSTIIEVRANRTHGAPVPGSGQRFIVRFQ
jgi:Big-like domain-containing protein